jgi:hypothetical protein
MNKAGARFLSWSRLEKHCFSWLPPAAGAYLMCWTVNSQAAVEHRLVIAIEGSESAIRGRLGVTFRKRFAHFLMEPEV